MQRKPPPLTEADEEVLRNPDEDYPADASPEQLDRAQFRQGAAVEREKEWVDPREIVGGEE
ncbi:MAG TPA: hypothetical protein VNT51_14000 [Miltoncostaeaceae bacterium]|nr:hypothetical protein [Miltoncostaeaceae bacterium]